MPDNPAIVAALIAASAALGAAFFAFAAALINAKVARDNAVLQVVIAQRTKRSEFRQNWINLLRESFTKVQSGLMAEKTEPAVAEHAMRMLLLMNRNDPDYERLRSATFSIVNKEESDKKQTRAEANIQFIAVCQDILKREWGVVKAEISHLDKPLK